MNQGKIYIKGHSNGYFFWKFLRIFAKSDVTNVPGPEAASIIRGSYGQLFNADAWVFHQSLAEKYGGVVRVFGAFCSSHLYISDTKAMYHVILKDQHAFEQSDSFLVVNQVNLGPGLLSTTGDQHRRQRKMLNPVFSIAHMRHMMPIFNGVTKRLGEVIRLKVADGPQEIDILHWMGRAALELIGQSGFGYSFDPLVEGMKPHPYSVAIKGYQPIMSTMAFHREYLLPVLVKIGTPRLRRIALNLIPWKKLHDLRDIVDVLHQTSVEILNEKKQALEKGDVTLGSQSEGKDMMSILMRANSQAADVDKLSEAEILGQISSFAFAGIDSTSNALSRILYLLSLHPKIQERLHIEITEAISNFGENIPYDDLVALPFLDAVCRETLRLYPPGSITSRIALQDFVLPLSTPVKGIDGREMRSILVPKGTKVFISMLNANRDPGLWGPDALEWKPDRWLSTLPQTVTDARIPGIYSNLMTFLGGGRACIGFKFSQLEMKAVLSTLISQFQFSPTKKIDWKMTTLSTPSVKGSIVPQLPLKIELAEKSIAG